MKTSPELEKFIKEEAAKMHNITLLEQRLKEVDNELKIINEGEWPKKLKKGRFTSYCKKQGFEGPGIGCSKEAMKSDDVSVRGMASFYKNTVKPGEKNEEKKTLSNLKEECQKLEQKLLKNIKK